MTSRTTNLLAATAAVAGIAAATATHSAERIPDNQTVRNVVLVHGAFADGSGWRGVYDELTLRGYRVAMTRAILGSSDPWTGIGPPAETRRGCTAQTAWPPAWGRP